jgi:hypothetical protein
MAANAARTSSRVRTTHLALAVIAHAHGFQNAGQQQRPRCVDVGMRGDGLVRRRRHARARGAVARKRFSAIRSWAIATQAAAGATKAWPASSCRLSAGTFSNSVVTATQDWPQLGQRRASL